MKIPWDGLGTHKVPADVVVRGYANVACHSRTRLTLACKVQDGARRVVRIGFGARELEPDVEPAKNFCKVWRLEERGLDFVVGGLCRG